MKLLLIMPYDDLYKHSLGYTKLISYEPLTLAVLAALVPPELNIDITIVDEGMEAHKINPKTHFDIVGISTVTSASKRAYELATLYRQLGSYIVMGGHHVTLLPDEAALHADSIFIGRSEKTWPQFFKDYIHHQPLKVYHQQDASPELHIPIPRRDLLKRRNYLKQPVIIANYGCKNKCNFCSISAFWKGCAPKRPIAEVIQEMKSLKTDQFIFLDPNQYSDQTYARELYQELVKLKIKWVGLATHNIADDDAMLELMVKSGCRGIFIGFESLNQQNLTSVNKEPNTVQKFRHAIDKIHYYGLTITGSFMVGFDHDTKESLAALPDLIEDLKLDIMRYGIVTPVPNTGLFHQMEKEGRILTRNWALYDSMHCVFQPKHMSPRELEEQFVKIWKKSYRYSKILQRLNYTQDLKLLKFLTGVGFRIYVNRLAKLLSL
jgi:radical SAM superfamily enzyme YgiQ (UPF0313 family)